MTGMTLMHLVPVLLLLSFCAILAAGEPLPPGRDAYAKIAKEVEASFERDIVGAWFPRSIDPAGGFHDSFDRQWNRLPSGGKFLVFQARMTWVSAQIAMRRPERREEFIGYVRHGLRCLNDTLWDKEHGGFYAGLEPSGKTGQFGPEKHVYGIAFGMYAAAAAYEATHDREALDLAMRTFRWLEEHAHDKKHGGYHEILTREGNVVPMPDPVTPANARYAGGGFYYGFKSMNSHIHLLEALAELNRVHADPLVKARTAEMLGIVRDKIAGPPGCLSLFFTPDWRPVPDHDSFGHDIETAFLLIEAAESLGQPDDPATLRMSRMLVDHTLNWGFDPKGGLNEAGLALGAPTDTKKIWWTQVEAMNALLLMHERFGGETDRYWKAFQRQWEFIRVNLIDPEHPGLFSEANPKTMNKANRWKAAYHDGRSLMRVSERLRKLASEP